MWRVIASPRIAASLLEVRERWTVMDVCEAWDALDFCEDLDAAAAEAAKTEVK